MLQVNIITSLKKTDGNILLAKSSSLPIMYSPSPPPFQEVFYFSNMMTSAIGVISRAAL